MTDDREAHDASTELEISASPEEIWDALTLGTAAWTFPTDVEPREGGAIRVHRSPFAPDALGTVTVWEPSRRFAYEEPGQAPDPAITTEFVIEAGARGSCVVRVLTTFHADGGTWDDIAEQTGTGWRMTLLLLRSYVTRFAGAASAPLDAMVLAGVPLSERGRVGAQVTEALGVQGLAEGDEFRAPAGAPVTSGTVDHLEPHFLVLRSENPQPALFAVSSFPMDARTLSVNVTGRVYGPGADEAAAREHGRWEEWLTRLLEETEH